MNTKNLFLNDRTTGNFRKEESKSRFSPSITNTLLIAWALLITPAVCFAGGDVSKAQYGFEEPSVPEFDTEYGYHPYLRQFAQQNPDLFRDVPEHLRQYLDNAEGGEAPIPGRQDTMRNEMADAFDLQMQESDKRMREMMEEQRKMFENQEANPNDPSSWTDEPGVFTQDDNNNSKIVVQEGENNRKNLVQKGENNQMGLFQKGKNNEGNISQSGENNRALTMQSGNNNRSSITQSGPGNSASISQGSSSNSAKINQGD